MTWTAKITSKNVENGALVVGLEYTDGTKVIQDKVSTRNINNSEWLKWHVKQKLESLQKVYMEKEEIQVGTFDYTVTDPVEPEPTKEEIDKTNFLTALTKLRQLDKAVELGLLTQESTTYQNAVNDVKTKYKADYLPIL